MRGHVTVLIALAWAASAHAGFTEYTENYTGWTAAAGPVTTIGFNDPPNNTILTDQYADLGVLFTAPWNIVDGFDDTGYLQDGFGLFAPCEIVTEFSQPITSIGWHFPDFMRVWFYSGDQLVYSDSQIGQGGEVNNFVGFTSDTPFDRVKLTGFGFQPCDDIVAIDNLYFSTIPAPGAAGLFGLFAVVAARRRATRATAEE